MSSVRSRELFRIIGITHEHPTPEIITMDGHRNWKARASIKAHTSSNLKEKVEGYLCLQNFHCFHNDESVIEEDGSLEELEDVDDVAMVKEGNQVTHSYEFHIVYSFSYKVPVLYFRGYKCDGQPLDLNQIENDLPLYSSLLLRQSKWTYITNEEHPFLHRPWYMLHPCGTREWMKLLLGDCSDTVDNGMTKDIGIKQYLPSWLSVVGQAVGLSIPLTMSTRLTFLNPAPVGN